MDKKPLRGPKDLERIKNVAYGKFELLAVVRILQGLLSKGIFTALQNLLYLIHLFSYCLTKISTLAKQFGFLVFSLFIVPIPFLCALPVQKPY